MEKNAVLLYQVHAVRIEVDARPHLHRMCCSGADIRALALSCALLALRFADVDRLHDRPTGRYVLGVQLLSPAGDMVSPCYPPGWGLDTRVVVTAAEVHGVLSAGAATVASAISAGLVESCDSPSRQTSCGSHAPS